MCIFKIWNIFDHEVMCETRWYHTHNPRQNARQNANATQAERRPAPLHTVREILNWNYKNDKRNGVMYGCKSLPGRGKGIAPKEWPLRSLIWCLSGLHSHRHPDHWAARPWPLKWHRVTKQTRRRSGRGTSGRFAWYDVASGPGSRWRAKWARIERKKSPKRIL